MPGIPVSVEAINLMPAADFVAAFGDVAEHSPWVAERAAKARPFADRRAMMEAFLDAIFDAEAPQKLQLLRSHPDLAGRAALAGDVAEESKREQAGAGLNTLTADEFAKFTRLNTAYREKFGFPFILAVKGATKHQILSSFEERMDRDEDAEFAAALVQVGRIIAFRLEDRVSP
jgi:2-oxo-4-hydroxy-4-carboxy-5-ureidoimidazoline decarboxylase